MATQKNKKVIKNIFLIIVSLCVIVLVLTRFFLTAAGTIPDGRLMGFAVDSSGNLYLGTMKRIDVYSEGAVVRTISPPTSRTYRFYIEDDKLIIGCVSDGLGGVFDLEGKEQSYGELSYYDIEEAAKQKKLVVNGHVYELAENHGLKPYTITRDGVEILRMSGLDYFFNCLPFACLLLALGMLIAALILIKVSDYQSALLKGEDPWKAVL